MNTDAIGIKNIDLGTYTDFVETETWLAPNDEGVLAPVDLTGCSAQLVVYFTPGDPAALFTISTTASSSGLITLGGVAGTIEISIPLAALAIFVGIGQATYDLFVTSSLGTVTKLLHGQMYIGQTVPH